MHALRQFICVALVAVAVGTPSGAVYAQELHQDLQHLWRGRVVEVSNERAVAVYGTEATSKVQELRVELLDGEYQGEIVAFTNDYIQVGQGDTVYLNHIVRIDGREMYSIHDRDRSGALLLVMLLFIAVILGFGGRQGVRSLLSLGGSLLVIVYVLVPSLVKGSDPVLVSMGVASLVLFCAVFLTHGFNRRSLIAYGGTIIAVGATGLLAAASIHITGLSGFSSDESVYLNLNTGGQLDFVGLLLAAIIIGALGVLDDIAVTQVAVVRELCSAGKKLTRKLVYTKAMRVGKEHVGALVNTLVLAYTGAALPLLLLFSMSESSVRAIINQEVFTTEIVRALVGSIGLVLTVPITTLLAVVFLYGRTDTELQNEHDGHGHSHGL